MQRARMTLLTLALLLTTIAWGAPATVARTAAQELMTGAVYTLTNSFARNEVVAYRRAADGTLSPLGHFDTGGLGSGAFENSDTMIVLGSAAGQSSPVHLGGGADLLFAANAGSDEISVFRIMADGRLELVETEPSGGERPISLTVRNGVLYVLNSAGDLTGAGFCFGGAPHISGFRVGAAGQLTPIPGSTRALSGGGSSGCAQVSFNPAGDVLLVTQLGTDTIDTFTVGADGIATGPLVNETTGIGPFGLSFDRQGRMLLTENFQAREGQSGVATYTVGSDGRLAPVGPTVRIGETDACWIVVTPDGRYAFSSNFGPVPFVGVRDEASRRGTLSSFRVGDDGALTLLDGQAAQVGVGSADIALGGGGHFIYALNSIEGTVSGWRIAEDASLTLITTIGGIPANIFGPLSAGMVAWDGPMDVPASLPSEMPPTPGLTGSGS